MIGYVIATIVIVLLVLIRLESKKAIEEWMCDNCGEIVFGMDYCPRCHSIKEQ